MYMLQFSAKGASTHTFLFYRNNHIKRIYDTTESRAFNEPSIPWAKRNEKAFANSFRLELIME